jgi:hypothetical protein
MSYVFGKPSTNLHQGLPKNILHTFPFLVIEKIQSPLDREGVQDGDQLFLVTTQHTPLLDGD